jgi:hypothetical protein
MKSAFTSNGIERIDLIGSSQGVLATKTVDEYEFEEE